MNPFARKEKVYHLVTEEEYVFIPELLGNRVLPQACKEHFYLPKRKEEIIRTSDIEKYLKKLEVAAGYADKPVPLVSIMKSGNTPQVLNEWEVRPLIKIPSGSTLMKIEKKRIDRLMNAHWNMIKEIIQNKNEPTEIDIFKFNPSEAEKKFYRVCEEVLLHKS